MLLIVFRRAKMAEDEPRCEQLRIENFELKGRLRASKEIQTIGLQELEKLKAEKSALLKRRVSPPFYFQQISS